MSNLSKKSVLRALLGNSVICSLKLGVWMHSGSSALFAEFVHTLVDTGNQALLFKGLVASERKPDKSFHYGYGKQYFFYALISALGMFASGAGVSFLHGFSSLYHNHHNHINNANAIAITQPSFSVAAVLVTSLLVDGYVLRKTLQDVKKNFKDKNTNNNDSKPMSLAEMVRQIKDPILLAVLLEDMAACTGVFIAGSGITLSWMYSNPAFDSIASVAVGGLLSLVAVKLIKINQQFLLGISVDSKIIDDITNNILMRRKGVEFVGSIKSQHLGPESFSYKAEVDFDGTFLYLTLKEKYLDLFLQCQSSNRKEDMQILMSFYAEDVTRLVEKEVRDCERAIQEKYPECDVIELEPDSKNFNQTKLTSVTELLDKEREEIRKLS